MKVLFINRPAAGAGQINSAQAGVAVSMATWMLGWSTGMRGESRLYYRNVCVNTTEFL